MGTIRRQSTISTVIIYLGVIIGFVGSAILRPKILSPDEIGFIQVLLNLILFLGAILTLGAHLLVVKMLPRFEIHDENFKGLFRVIIYFGIAGAIIALPILALTENLFLENNHGDRFANFEYSFGFYAVLYLVIVVRIFNVLFDNFLRARQISIPGVFSDSILLKFLPILILTFYFLGLIDFIALVYLNLLTYALPLLVSLFYLKEIKAFNWNKPGPFTGEEKTEMIFVSAVGMMEIVSYFIVLFIDIFMLKRLMNDEAVGIYATMFFFGAVVSIPLKALVRIAQPIISESFAKNDLDSIASIYRKSSNVLFLLGSFVFLLVWGNRYSIENFLDPIYAKGIWVVFFIGLAHLVEVLSSVNYQIISITPYFRFNLYMGACSILLLISTNYLFISMYGIVGVAIGSLISMVLVNLARHVFLVKKYQLSPFSKNTLYILIIGLIVFGISELIPNVENLFLNAAIKSAIVSVLFLPAVYWLKCSDDFNAVIDKYLKK